MTLLKKNDKRRKWRSFKKNIALVGGALLSAVVITLTWYAAWTNGFHFANEADIPRSSPRSASPTASSRPGYSIPFGINIRK